MQIDVAAQILLLGLFPGICFSIFYLKGITEYARNDNLKLLSFHTFFAVIFITLFLIICLFLSWLINLNSTIASRTHSLPNEIYIICLLSLYLSSFYVAFRMGLFLCKKDFLYGFIKPSSHWDKIFFSTEKPNLFITTIVETGGMTWLYVGVLDDYQTNNGELEYIKISAPYRRAIQEGEPRKEKKPFSERFYQIEVDTLIIKYSDIRSLGISRIKEENLPEI